MTSKAEYLKRYLSGGSDVDVPAAGEKKKRKRKKDKTAAAAPADGAAPKAKKLAAGVRIHDEDVDDWKYRREEAEAARLREEETPVVVGEDGREATSREDRPRQYLGIREDGSGWTVADGDGDDDPRDQPRAPRRTTTTRISLPRDPRGTIRTTRTAMTKATATSPLPDEVRGTTRTMKATRISPLPDEVRGTTRTTKTTATSPLPDEGRGTTRTTKTTATSPLPDEGARHNTDEKGDQDLGDQDLSPPRRARHVSDEDLSPPRRGARADSDEDLSPPRRPPPGERTMTDGTSTGLVDASEVVREAAEKRRVAAARIAAMTDAQSGRGAATAVRDKATGRLMDADEVAARRAAAGATREREKPVWASGVAQAREAMDSAAALREEAANPFARSEMDASADAAARDAARFGDPMAHLTRKKTGGVASVGRRGYLRRGAREGWVSRAARDTRAQLDSKRRGGAVEPVRDRAGATLGRGGPEQRVRARTVQGEER